MNDKTIQCEIPHNLHIDKIIENNPPDFSYKVDGFIYLIDLWFKQYVSRKKDITSSEKEYVAFHSQTLKVILYDYQKYLEYLVNNDIFKVNSSYQAGIKSKSYKLNEIFYTENVEYSITDSRLISKINKYNLNCFEIVDKKFHHLLSWFDGLEINEEKALDYVNDIMRLSIKPKAHASTKRRLQLKKNSYVYSIKRIANKNYSFKIDEKSGRLYTPLTNLKKEFRSFITYKGQSLVCIDLSNSQPFLSTLLMNKSFYNGNNDKIIDHTNLTKWVYYNNIINFDSAYTYISKDLSSSIKNKCRYNPSYTNKSRSLPMCGKNSEDADFLDEWRLYMNLVEKGKFYSYIGNHISLTQNNRLIESPKKLVITVLFSDLKDNRKYFVINRKVFADLFPSTNELFNIIKSNNHALLSVLLQNIESEMFLIRIANRITKENPSIPFYTIHDSICTTVPYLNKVRYIINDEIKKSVGLRPNLKIDYWK